MVAPHLVGTPTVFASATSGATIVLDKPTVGVTVQNGDVLVVALRANGTNSATDFTASGFTRRGYPFVANDAAGRVTGVYTHVVTDATSEPSTYTFSKDTADTRRAGIMGVVRGADVEALVAGNSSGWDASQAPRVQLNSFNAPVAIESLLVYAWAAEVVSPNASEPTSTPGAAIGMVASSPGTAATRSVIWFGSEPVNASPTGHKSLTWTSASGAAATGFVIRGVSTPQPPPAGFSSVAHMLATPGATWAHRGGSANWPEMSKYAYEQAAEAGYGALEFSANRTSDGVWVGCHDASLNRTSQTTGLADISAMTWAQVQSYQNMLNSAGTPRAYYRLDQFLDDFTATHVVIVDPKHAIGTHNTEFLNLLDAHGGNTKIVVKFYGVGSGATGLADAATARGYETWGYFYDTDVTRGDLAKSQAHWSLLGMNYDAPQAAWDAVLSYEKPVVGHIAASRANYNTAISRGSRMVQCANVTAITAVGATAIVAPGALTVTGAAARTVEITRTADGVLTLTGQGERRPTWPKHLAITATVPTLTLEATW